MRQTTRAKRLRNISGTTTLNQTRTHQTVNEITAISGGVTPGYDANGNMTTMPQVDNWSTAQTLTYDAWNRPITVKQSTTTLGTYQYDGLNRRIWKQSLESGTLTTRHFYYSDKWQVLEERTGSSTTADRQYVWGTRYEDDLVLRDRFVGTTDRLYALADYFQPTAIANTSGVVQERYVYRAFGDVSYYNGSFSPISSSAYAWTYLYASYPLDLETALYQVRYRYYHSALGRWINRDPLKNAELTQGSNLYWYVQNNAVNIVDPLGLGGWVEKSGSIQITGLWSSTGVRYDWESASGEGVTIADEVYGEYSASATVTCTCSTGKEQSANGTRIAEKPLGIGPLAIRTSSAASPLVAPAPASILSAIGKMLAAITKQQLPKTPLPTADQQTQISGAVKAHVPSQTDIGDGWQGGSSPCSTL